MADNPFLGFLQGAKRAKATLAKALGLAQPGQELSEFDLWVLNGFTQPVTSSWIRSMAYDARNQSLILEFKGGGKCSYDPVPVAMVKGFYYTGSHGTWWWDYIGVRGKGNKGKHQVNMKRL